MTRKDHRQALQVFARLFDENRELRRKNKTLNKALASAIALNERHQSELSKRRARKVNTVSGLRQCRSDDW